MRTHARGIRRRLVFVVGVALGCVLLVPDVHSQQPVTPADGPPQNAAVSPPPVGRNPLLRARVEQTFAASDFNKDGLSDVAVADFLKDEVRVSTASAAGTFHVASTLATGRGPRAVATADFNRDGAMDVAVAEFFSGTVSVFAGRGDGRFGARRSIGVARGVNSLLARDFDGDGREDLVVANALSGAVSWLRNAGDGSFGAAEELGRFNAVTVLMADVDADGTLDLAAIDAQGREALMFAGRLRGRFAPAAPADPAGVLSAAEGAATGGSAQRLVRIAGDGVAQQAGPENAETVVVEVRDSGGAAPVGDGQTVVFSRVGGLAEAVGADAPSAEFEHIRTTDPYGRASLAVALPALPDVSVIAAALPTGQAAHFGLVSVASYPSLVDALEPALRQEPADSVEEAARIELLRGAARSLRKGDAAGSVLALHGLLERLAPGQTVSASAQGEGGATDLLRRLINQVLLTGVAPAVADDEPIVCGVPLTRTIDVATETDTFRFACEAGEVVSLGIAPVSGSINPVFRLLAPGGTPAPSCGTFGFSLRDCTLTVAGDYAVEVVDSGFDGTGSYSLHLQRLTAGQRCGGGSLTCGAPVTGTTTAPTETDLYSFPGVAGEVVSLGIAAVSGTINPVFRLIAPNGTPAPSCGAFGFSLRDCTLTVAGDYAVEVVDSGFDGTGSYSLHLQRLTAGQRCGGGSLTCGAPVTGTTTAPTETDLYSFPGVAGEVVSLGIAPVSGSINPVFRLIAPNGTPAPSCGAFGFSLRDCTLTVAGDYAVEVVDSGFDGTGSYSLHLQRLTAGQRCGGGSLTCGAPVTGTTTAPTETDLYSFPGVAGEVVSLGIAPVSGSINPVFRLIAPNGTPAPSCGAFGFSLRDCTLTVAGDYAVEVVDSGFDGTGSYSLHLQRLTAGQRCGGGSLTCGAPVTGTTTAPTETDLYSFPGVAGEVVSLGIAPVSGSINPVFRLIAPNGTPAPSCGAFGFSLRDCTLTVAGDYAVEVVDSGFDGTGSYSLHLQRLTAGQRCGGGSLTCGAPVTGTTTAPTETDLYSFPGVAGEVVSLGIAPVSGSINPVFRLIAPNGTPAPSCGAFGFSLRDCTLTVAGDYAVEVVDSGFDGTGSYSLHLQRLTAGQRCGGSLTCGVPVTGTTTSRAETDLYTFTGVSGQSVSLSVAATSGSINPVVRLIAPSGTPEPSCGAFAGGTRPCALTASGQYAVEVADSGFDATGGYTLTISGAGCTSVQPNLRVSALKGKGVAGAGLPYVAKDTTLNNGAGAAPISATRFFLSADATWDAGDVLLVPVAGRSVPALAPGGSNTGSTTVTIPAGTPIGKRFLLARADAAGTVTESDENDNTKSKTLYVGPDLTVKLTAPASSSPGLVIAVTVTTKNSGGAPTVSPTTTRLYFSSDKKVGPTDVPLGQVVMPALAAGASNITMVNVTIPATPLGNFYIVARADDAGVETESRETNNVKAVAIQIN